MNRRQPGQQVERQAGENPDCSAKQELDRLADFILEHVPGEPSRNEGAVDCAIRILRRTLAVEAQRAMQRRDEEANREAVKKLALYIRREYADEVAQGLHSGMKDVADAAIHYMSIERDLVRRGLWGRIKYLLWGV